ncbi:NgoBV family restriction endonuclease [Mycoplasmopsis caviae]|uniref:NgoBV family restriction endonuclease n=1 Tax=Mycoplasmopsis caviae TaxID=55603 RepID=A0A3P8MDQ1_9BACT|nr:NgoBV family restriction endonuclease [Mycoplasmopsis caviae]UUD35075.1 NgoBV family restriction endonuclease [Mycoplasmopsis caviae]VDR42100.1 NgoBV restriction endonuclease [Mycoplasmopsis caviae]
MNNKMERSVIDIFNMLKADILHKKGKIVFELSGIKAIIDSLDIVGISIQNWLKVWLMNKNIYFDMPKTTQEFPDFYLSMNDKQNNMLEIKTFNCTIAPSFDIANYESFINSIVSEPYRLNADYIIFSYQMDKRGTITINNAWLMKIWEIAGSGNRYPLKVQVKRNTIYNIRPNSRFKNNAQVPFANKEQFLNAIYETEKMYKGVEIANRWKERFKISYKNYCGTEIKF